MTCEWYWREGILLVERGEHDAHLDTCLDCRRAHAARGELIAALPHVGATRTGDPAWQMRVWSRIARHEAQRARRSYWLGGGLAAAAAIAAVWLVLVRGDTGSHAPVVAAVPPELAGGGGRPRIDIVTGTAAMRSTSARVGDRVRISVLHGGEVRVYRADHLVLRCPAWQRSASCTLDRAGLVAETELATAGEYQLVVISPPTADPAGSLDDDIARVVAAGGNYKLTELSVR